MDEVSILIRSRWVTWTVFESHYALDLLRARLSSNDASELSAHQMGSWRQGCTTAAEPSIAFVGRSSGLRTGRRAV